MRRFYTGAAHGSPSYDAGMAAGPVAVQREPGIAVVTIDSPPLNLVDGPFIGALLQLLPDLEADDDLRVVVFRSADPDFFLMHADVEALVASPALPRVSDTEPNVAVATFERIRREPFVTIGVLDGAARGGGCEFLSSLDLRLGTPRAVIGQPEVPLGILPGAGGTVRWAQLVGRAKALELLLTGRDINAQEAMQLGWLLAIHDRADVDAAALDLARTIARMPRESIAAVKYVVDIALGSIHDALVAESNQLAALMTAGAHIEPMRRFLAAGGQTREAERDDFATLIERTLEP
jgi:enoyl-CoA hydratase/carnithine racemase